MIVCFPAEADRSLNSLSPSLVLLGTGFIGDLRLKHAVDLDLALDFFDRFPVANMEPSSDGSPDACHLLFLLPHDGHLSEISLLLKEKIVHCHAPIHIHPYHTLAGIFSHGIDYFLSSKAWCLE